MNKAVIFDFDGVLINSEYAWEVRKDLFFRRLFGDHITNELGSTTGLSIDAIYDKSVQLGSIITKEVFVKEVFDQAPLVYNQANLALGIDTIGEKLTGLGYKIGIVSASPLEWIEIGLSRTSLKNHVTKIISLQNRKDLAHKPAPDGYREMMLQLESTSTSTLIVEDSATGIKSARGSGAHVIYSTEFIQGTNKVEDFDSRVSNLSEIIELL